MKLKQGRRAGRIIVVLGYTLLAAVPLSAAADAQGISLSEKLTTFQKAFADKVISVSGTHVKFADGTAVLIDDGRTKSHQAKLKNADVEDMFSQIYPVAACVKGKPAQNFDPGRIRNDRVMRALFGTNKSAAIANQTTVKWFGQRLRFSRAAGADQALTRVARDLAALLKKQPRLARFVRPSAGTFNWRNIAGTKRLSVHSFGAAIDINTKYTDYWRWSGGKPGRVPRYRNKIPLAIVEVFERHGFIWGGRWYHFDTMHFEYRPDLIAIGRLTEKRGCAG